MADAAAGVAAPAGRPYPQLLRTPGTPGSGGWRPLVCLLYGAATTVAVLFQVSVYSGLAVEAAGGGEDTLFEGPGGFLFTNLLIASLIGVALAAVAVAFLRPPGVVHSVEGRLRTGWLLRCTAITAVWALLVSVLYLVLDGVPDTGGEQAALVILVGLATTPLQAAGEEYAIRGWLTQCVAAWFARPVVGAVVAGLVSATVFAFLHGQQDPWLWADRFAFGLIASWLVWWTGGLEAAIALHALANLTAVVPAALEGTLDDALTATSAPAVSVVFDVVTLLLAAAALGWAARRFRVRRLAAPDGPDGTETVTAPPPAGAGPVPSAPPAG